MKALLVALSLFGSVAAHAADYVEYDWNAKDLLTTVFTSCPKEFAEAMEGANSVKKAEFELSLSADGTAARTYTITTSGGGFAPTFRSYDVATLEIKIESVPENFHIPNKPPEWKTTCTVTKH